MFRIYRLSDSVLQKHFRGPFLNYKLDGIQTIFSSRSCIRQPVSRSIQTMTSTDVPSAPPLSHILETILYVRDLENSVKFYAETLQVQPFFRMVCYNFVNGIDL